MRKSTVVANVLLAVVAALLTSSPPMMFAQTSQASTREHRVGPGQVFLTNAQLDPNENYQVIRAFVKTGSLDPDCLVTLGDTSFVATGTLVFCAPRQPTNLGRGIMISIFYPEPPADGLTLSVTLFQKNAKKYGPPVLCDVDGC